MEYILLVIGIIIILLLIFIIVKTNNQPPVSGTADMQKFIDTVKNDSASSNRELRADISSVVQENMKNFSDIIASSQKNSGDIQTERITEMGKQIGQNLADMGRSLTDKQENSNSTISDMALNLQESVKKLGDMIVSSQKNSGDMQTERIAEMGRQISQNLVDMGRSLTDKQESSGNAISDMALNLQESVKKLGDMIVSSQKNSGDMQTEHIAEMGRQISQKLSDMDKLLSDKQESTGNAINEQLKVLENRFKSLESNNEIKLENMRNAMTQSLMGIQEENSRKLEAIQATVNEKLENKMNESFRLVSDRLEQVYKGLGEMQSIASGVGDLKKVLSNVKNRGILGEIQLGAILSEILAPEQYEREVATVPESSNRVEFAVKLPGNGNHPVYLPIDSKFPGDTFSALQDAYDTGNPDEIAAAKKQLNMVIRKCAKDISEKYIMPPYTTNFGIMFLPFEGLYAEVANSGLIETLQKEYNVNITGPSTMAAMLNSLQMGFQTLAIQKKSNQVWEVLGSVKSEFQKFAQVLEDTQKHIKKVDDDLEKLVGVRTRQINRKLNSVEIIESTESYD